MAKKKKNKNTRNRTNMVEHEEIEVTSGVVNDTYAPMTMKWREKTNAIDDQGYMGRTERVMELKATQNVDHDYWHCADWDECADCRRQHNARK